MILVILGTQDKEFRRLLVAVEELVNIGVISQKVIVQAGHTKYSSNCMEILELVSKDELEQYIKSASYIITHGGVGSILQCMSLNKKVIAVPRSAKYYEHVNDHQCDLINAFNEKGYIIGLSDLDELKGAVEKIDAFEQVKYVSNNEEFIKVVKNFIDN